jgi:hypothetical protein
MQCSVNSGVQPRVRAEGIAELVGDIVITCAGGKPTSQGVQVPRVNFAVILNTNLTSRIISQPDVSEALMLIDEPHSPSNAKTPLAPCTGLKGCTILGTGTGTGTYDGSTGRPNVFAGTVSSQNANRVEFLGIPLDPPASYPQPRSRVIRITNLRGNASQVEIPASGLPGQITAYVSVTGPSAPLLSNPQLTVAYIQNGLTASTANIQCSGFSLRIDEGSTAAWKEKNIATRLANTARGSSTPMNPSDAAQDNTGSMYVSESSFEVNGVTPNSGSYLPANAPFPETLGLIRAGVADFGTRVLIRFGAVPNGAQILIPIQLNLTNAAHPGSVTGFAVLIATDADGNGAYQPLPGNAAGLAEVSISRVGSGTAVYEILFADTAVNERITVPVLLGGTAGQSAQMTASVGFAAVSTENRASATAPVPRFLAAAKSFSVGPQCRCRLLFPFVTSQAGYNTRIAVANTSRDPFGTVPESGKVTVYYYGGVQPGNNGPPDPKTTSGTGGLGGTVPGGCELVFTLRAGGAVTNCQFLGTSTTTFPAAPGFEGYIIAVTTFPSCQGYAMISDTAEGRLSNGYLAIRLDTSSVGQSEVIGH